MSFDPKIYDETINLKISHHQKPSIASKVWITVLQLLFLAAAGGVTVFFALTVFS